MPEQSRVGQVVHISRGYTVAEIIEVHDSGEKISGFSVFGYRPNTALVFPTREAAIAELVALADLR
jgi:hypothetical protein